MNDAEKIKELEEKFESAKEIILKNQKLMEKMLAHMKETAEFSREQSNNLKEIISKKSRCQECYLEFKVNKNKIFCDDCCDKLIRPLSNSTKV